MPPSQPIHRCDGTTDSGPGNNADAILTELKHLANSVNELQITPKLHGNAVQRPYRVKNAMISHRKSLSFETRPFRPKMLHFRKIRGPRMGATMEAEHRIDRALKPAL
jgi:hypothetical protein